MVRMSQCCAYTGHCEKLVCLPVLKPALLHHTSILATCMVWSAHKCDTNLKAFNTTFLLTGLLLWMGAVVVRITLLFWAQLVWQPCTVSETFAVFQAMIKGCFPSFFSIAVFKGNVTCTSTLFMCVACAACRYNAHTCSSEGSMWALDSCHYLRRHASSLLNQFECA